MSRYHPTDTAIDISMGPAGYCRAARWIRQALHDGTASATSHPSQARPHSVVR